MSAKQDSIASDEQESLKQILEGVSRSFYLSIKFLPKIVRRPIGLAFLACKAADTIADTKLIVRARRLEILHQYHSLFENEDENTFSLIKKDVATTADNPHEQQLLLSLPQLFAAINDLAPNDRKIIHELVQELIQGMTLDLTHFPGDSLEDLQAFNNDEELDQYTYYVAGCVGIFWTRILREHFEFARGWNRKTMKELGEKFGKGLQMVNILRDFPRDLQNGRCYLPANALRQRGLEPHHLLEPSTLLHVRPYLEQLLARTRKLLACGRNYAAAHPAYALRLKWVVLLPMKLGFQTLDLLEKSENWLDPEHVIKVSRGQVYRTMASSFLTSLRPMRLAHSSR